MDRELAFSRQQQFEIKNVFVYYKQRHEFVYYKHAAFHFTR